MLEGIFVILHIVIVIVGIGEKVVLHGEDIGRTHVGFGEECFFGLPNREEMASLLVVIEVFALLVSKVGGGFAIPDDAGRSLHPNGPMIGGQNNFDVAGTEGLQCAKERGKLQPGLGKRSVGRFIGRKLPDDVHLRARVRQQVDEVVDNRVEVILHQIEDVVGKGLAILWGDDFVIAMANIKSVPLDLFRQKQPFMLVLPSFFIIIEPLFGKSSGDLRGHHP